MQAHELGFTSSPFAVPQTRPQETDTVDFMIEQVHKYPGKVTIMAVAGLTNVAMAIQKDPSFVSDAAGIVYMGGVLIPPVRSFPAWK